MQSIEAQVTGAARPLEGRKKSFREIHRADRFFSYLLLLPSILLGMLLLLIGSFLIQAAWPSIRQQGPRFLVGSTWDPVQHIYGALPVIYGTVLSSLIAVLIAAPLSIGIALFLTEVASRRVGRLVGFLVEMLAAIPSVVYGLWGIFVLAPWLRETVEPMLKSSLGFLPFFQGPIYGVGMLAAGIILAIMITPTIASISREVFGAIPQVQREAALALGATRWEMMRLTVVKGARAGVTGAVMLGLGRALGETMAVTMVIGNRFEVSASLFAPGATMASIIANEYAEASSDAHLAALAEIGVVLFFVTFAINAIARLVVRRSSG
jgi:phosphate transport system permease protein